MKKILEKIKAWFGQSNRMAHLKMGFIIYVLTLVCGSVLMCLAEGSLVIGQSLADRLMIVKLIDADWCVFGCMCAVEFDQMLHGEKFDWLDVLAGCVIPLALTVVLSLIILIA